MPGERRYGLVMGHRADAHRVLRRVSGPFVLCISPRATTRHRVTRHRAEPLLSCAAGTGRWCLGIASWR
jgi:hypothetical protein